jgi:Ribbon-helix-helix protein, copG family
LVSPLPAGGDWDAGSQVDRLGKMSKSSDDRARLTVTVQADLVEWLREKAKWQQRSMSDIVEDGLIDLREKMGEPGHPKGIERLPEKAQQNIARLRARHRAEGSGE